MKALTARSGISAIVKPADYLNGLVWWVPCEDNAADQVVLSRVGPANGELNAANTEDQTVQLAGKRALLMDQATTVAMRFGDILDRGANDFSLCAWVRWDGSSSSIRDPVISKQNESGTQTGFTWHLNPTSQKIEFNCGTDLSSSANRSLRTASTAHGTGNWHMVGVTWDSSAGAIDMILNGALDNGSYTNQNGANDDIDNSGQLRGGWRINSSFGSWVFKGALSDLRMYDHKLATADFLRIYNATKHHVPGH